MTRENLIQAIYDNEENWSCAYSCPHTMEEENPKDVCWKCAERLLSEYEQKIIADTIEEFIEWFLNDCYLMLSKETKKEVVSSFMRIKEQNNERWKL